MKTKRITLTIDVPASADVVTAGLDPQRLCPELPAAHEKLVEAERQLASARADIQQRKKLIDQHTREVATRGTAAVDDFEKESVALKRAEMLLPMWERNVVEAKRAVADARDRAIRVSQNEIRQRQAVLDAGAAQLFTALEELADLEDALAARSAQLPSVASEGVFSVASIRNRLIVMSVR